MLNDQQEQFCQTFLVSGNATEACKRTGYHPKHSTRLMKNKAVKERLSGLMNEKASEYIASADEVLAYLTQVMRGECTSEDGKAPDEKDRIKAATLLGKRYGLFREVVSMDVILPVIVDNVAVDDA